MISWGEQKKPVLSTRTLLLCYLLVLLIATLASFLIARSN